MLSSENLIDPKKSKLLFVTSNRYSSFTVNKKTACSTPTHTQINAKTPEANNKIKIKSPPPIFVREVLDLVSFRQNLISLIVSDNFLFKSSTNVLNIQTINPDSYRKTIYFLREKDPNSIPSNHKKIKVFM